MAEDEKIKVEVKTEEEAKEEAKSRNPWIYSTVILAIAVLAILGMQMTGMLAADGETQTAVQNQMASQDAAQKAVSFINDNLVQPGSSVTLDSVTEMSGIYNVTTLYSGNEIPVYVTLDGKYLMVPGLGAIDMDSFEAPEPTEPEEPEQPSGTEVPKSDKPVLNYFIMSYCPYGIQMVKAIAPVQELLGEKAEINTMFVSYILHGQKEEDENYRMICLREEQPEKLWDYLECFAESDDSDACIAEVGIDEASLDDCFANRAAGYYEEDKTLNTEYGVRGSPTVVLNDQVISVTRSPEAVKQAICNAFNTAPEECLETLSTSQASPGFGSSTSGSGGGSASC